MTSQTVHLRGRKHAAAVPSGDERVFCALPFTEVSIDEAGDVWPNCCPDWVEFPLGNLLTETWEQVWNGERAQDLRRSMHDGSARHCDAAWCPHLQAAREGVPDHRVRRHRDRHLLDLPPEARVGRSHMRSGPVNVGMHYEPSCNLACPTCRSDFYTVSGPEADAMHRLHEVVEAEVLAHPTSISLTGTGDPFASPFLREFLIGFEPSRFPRLERIHLHTNAILWTPALWDRMSGVHAVDVTTDISIDAACAATYEVVRRPARWDRLLENLAFIGTIPNVSSIGISMTVSQANVSEVRAFHDFAITLAETIPRLTFVEYKRVRRRWDHDDPTWRAMGLEHLDHAGRSRLADHLAILEQRRSKGARPEVRSNLADFVDLSA